MRAEAGRAGRAAVVPARAGGAGPIPTSRWRDRAACRGIEDPDLFFPAAEPGAGLAAAEAAAKAVCARCAVRVECGAFALVALPEGIAGGLTAAERGTHPGHTGAGERPGWREVTAAGRAAARSGRPVRLVAREFGVSERTALRWAAHVRAETDRAPAVGATG